MKFRTASTTVYELTNIHNTEIDGLLAGDLARISDKGIGHVKGGRFKNNIEFHEVLFSDMPQIGYSFQYVHPLWQGCTSTPISEFLDEDYVEPHECQDHHGDLALGDPCLICHPTS